jgi:hypothetical protein
MLSAIAAESTIFLLNIFESWQSCCGSAPSGYTQSARKVVLCLDPDQAADAFCLARPTGI